MIENRDQCEDCPKCEEGKMIHPQLYTFTCDRCRFSYQIDPNAPRGESGIRIKNKGEVLDEEN
jgi:hypothetical protein